ncbi:MAG: zinc-ribbon domain-containing protein [Promethearchaeota archaeon]
MTKKKRKNPRVMRRNYRPTEKNRLDICFPDLVKEWHPTKNDSLNPSDVSYGSNKKFWWLCSAKGCDHEWKTSIKARTRKKPTGCPACAGHIVTDRNRLSIIHPELVKEWHPTKNGSLTPDQVSYASIKSVWWLCSRTDCDQEWETVIAYRTGKKGTGCAAYSGHYITDKNRLSIKHPELVKEWHPTKNGSLTPDQVSYGSGKTVWWLCSKTDCNHEWKTTIQGRTSRGRGCPACTRQIVSDRNRLSLHSPHLVKEWHPTKNGTLTLDQVSYGSKKKVWWLCSAKDCNNEWEAQIKHRVTNHSGCPSCASIHAQFIPAEYWQSWQRLCETIAPLIYPDCQIYYQHNIGDIRPDIIIYDHQHNLLCIIDAKITGVRKAIKKTIQDYAPYTKQLEFWCLSLSKDIYRPDSNLTNDTIQCYDTHQLLMRINDIQARTLIERLVHEVQRATYRFLRLWRIEHDFIDIS